MATTTFSYNGFAFPKQLGKVTFIRNAQDIVISTAMTIPTATLDAVLAILNAWDETLVISWATPKVETWSVATNAVNVRTTAAKDGSPIDGGLLQRIVFTARIRLKDVKAGDDGFESWVATVDRDNQGAHVITISGVVTGTSGGNTAVENFDAGIGAIEDNFKTLYSGVYNKAQRSTRDNDRHNNILTFISISVEELEAVNFITGGGAETFDPLIMFYRWNMSEQTLHNQGHDNARETRLTIDFGCIFDRTFASGPAELKSGIAALVMKRAKAQFGYSGLILLDEGRNYSSTEQNASGRWVFRVDKGSIFTAYSEVISDFTNFGSYLKMSNGSPLSIKSFSPGTIMELTQTVDATSQGNSPSGPPVPAIAIRGANAGKLIALTRLRDRGDSDLGDTEFGTGGENSLKVKEHTFRYVQRYVVSDSGGVTTG